MTPDGSLPPDDRQGDWYYVDAGDIQGPVSWWSLLNLLVAGEIPSDSLVWRPGMEDWARAHLLSEIASYLPPEVPKSPRSVESGTTVRRPKVPEPSAHDDVPQSHPNSPTEGSGRGVAAIFVIAILVVVGAVMSLEDERPSGDAALMFGDEGSEVLLDGTLAGFPESKRTIVRDYLVRFERTLRSNLSAGRLDTLASFEAGYLAGQQWTRRGRRRLSDAELSRSLALESKVLHGVDKWVCGRILQGTADRGEEVRALMVLDTTDLRRLLDLRSRAFRAELESELPRRPMPSDDSLWSAIAATLEAMPRAQADSLQRAFGADSIAPDQECWATRAMYQYASEIPEPHRTVITRYLLWLGTESGVS